MKKYGSSWDNENSPSKAQLKIGGIASGIEKNFILELEIPPTENLQELNIGFAILNFIADNQNFAVKKDFV